MYIKNIKFFSVVMVAMLFTMPVQAAEIADIANVRHMSGNITQIDIKLGTVTLKSDLSPGMGDMTQYRINKNDTRVTDALDRKFLTIDNLLVGQYAIIDIIKGEEDKIVKKIVVSPYLAPGLQQSFGDLQAIDITAGTLTLAERPTNEDMDQGDLSYFVFDPKEIIVMQDSSPEPVQLVLKVDDQIRVVYVIKGDQKVAQSITLYTADVTQTTVTTTTTTTTTP